MSDIFHEIEERANLAFTNQMEMLTFHLTDGQLYGINVFKVIECIECPEKIIKMPYAHPAIKGTIDHRGKPIAVIDLSLSLAMAAIDHRKEKGYVIICEYNSVIHGFLIKSPDKLIKKNWNEIKSPTGLLSNQAYLTSLAYTDEGVAVQILDIEKILSEILGMEQNLSEEMVVRVKKEDYSRCHVLGVDDSRTARSMLKTVFEEMGVRHTLMDSAVKAFEYLEGLSIEEISDLRLIISDIEMPGIDGFTFTRKIKEIPRLANIHVMLHSSMSNKSNMMKAKEVGADDFLAKFHPDSIAENILKVIK